MFWLPLVLKGIYIRLSFCSLCKREEGVESYFLDLLFVFPKGICAVLMYWFVHDGKRVYYCVWIRFSIPRNLHWTRIVVCMIGKREDVCRAVF